MRSTHFVMSVEVHNDLVRAAYRKLRDETFIEGSADYE